MSYFFNMSDLQTPQKARFTSKGQIVIPANLRRSYEIESGSEVVVEETAEGILLKPVTPWAIRKARGIAKPRGKTKTSFTKEWAEHKADELELENAKLKRHARNGRLR
ncbi:MAG: hypothetical protein SynsKO_02940 [Synoicihabitans sp.]